MRGKIPLGLWLRNLPPMSAEGLKQQTLQAAPTQAHFYTVEGFSICRTLKGHRSCAKVDKLRELMLMASAGQMLNGETQLLLAEKGTVYFNLEQKVHLCCPLF